MAARRLGGVRCLVAAWIGATLVAVLSASGWAGASPSSGRLWTASFADAQHGYDTAQAAVVSPDGGLVYVTGYRGNGHQTGDYLTIAFDAATGKRVWQRAYDGPQHLQDFPAAIGVSPNGSTVFVTGTSAGAANEDVATVAYDALTGTLLWATRFDGRGTWTTTAPSSL